NWTSDGYRMNRLTNYCGVWIRHCGWYPDTKLRLLDARKGRWSGINPHDRFEMRDPGATLGSLNGDILHYSYSSISGHLKQVDYFTEISAKELHAKGNRATMFQILTSPVFRFLRDYFWKRGFLDGYYGLIICAISSQASFLKYAKLRELSRNS
ncbi:MAG: glycosyltransferase family 2 protein, partial [Bacteroidota bacterium]